MVAKHAAECFGEVFIGECCFHRAIGEECLIDQHDLVTEARYAAEVMGGNQNEATFGGEAAEEDDEGFFGFDVYASEWFVEEDDLAALCEGAGDKDAFFLSAAKLADLAVFKFTHIDAF